jgi:hypothetical protein
MSHPAPANVASLPENRLGPIGPMVARAAAMVGLVAVAAAIVMAMLSVGGGWRVFLRSYLFAFEFILAIHLGALFFVMLQHCVKAGWSVTVRRVSEGIAGNLQWLWILFIPIAIGMWTGNLYDWVEHPGHGGKYEFYLTRGPWLARSAVFLLVWALLARFFVRTSIAQDITGEVSLTRRMEKFAPIGMLLYALTQSYASMDWVMSLDSAWFSTMFPVYFFAASCCGFFATLILMCVYLQRMGRTTQAITVEHFHDMGKLLFAFGIVFWAYIAYSQYMLIWYANIPEEVPFYLTRQASGWLYVSILLLVGHFAAPFLGIISRHPKRQPAVLAFAAVWMLFMAALDIFYLTIPDVPDQLITSAATYAEFQEKATAEVVNFRVSFFGIASMIGLGALALAGTFRTLSTCSLIPEHDPRLHEALAFENY